MATKKKLLFIKLKKKIPKIIWPLSSRGEGVTGEALGPGHYFLFFFCGYPKFHDGQFLFVLRS